MGNSLGKTKEITFFDEKQAGEFLKAAKGDRLFAMFHFALTTGARPEEYFGLKWQDIDFAAGRAEVRRVLIVNRSGGGWRFRDWPKTHASRRTLQLEPETVAVLQEHRKHQLAECIKAGKRYTHHDLVFTAPLGGTLHGPNVHRRNFLPILEAAKLTDKPYTPYSLRHTFATLSIAAGASPKAVSYALGHASVKFTLDVYCHIVDSIKLDASGKLGRLLFKGARSAKGRR